MCSSDLASLRQQRLGGHPPGEHTVDVRPQRAEVHNELQVDIHVDKNNEELFSRLLSVFINNQNDRPDKKNVFK